MVLLLVHHRLVVADRMAVAMTRLEVALLDCWVSQKV
jgi:hypothetical protein